MTAFDAGAAVTDLIRLMTAVASHAEGKLLAGRIGSVGVMVLNQPEKRNAMTLEMWEGLVSALDTFEEDDSVRAIILTGAGRAAFCSGNDVSQFADRRGDAEANKAYSRITGRGREKLSGFLKPSIACIQGYCIGGGLALALLADIRIAGTSAVFAIPAARLGIAYGAEALEHLVSVIGAPAARLMIYSAKRFDAREALAMGLVTAMGDANPEVQSLELAQTIAKNAPLSVRAAKFTIDQLMKAPQERDPTVVQAMAQRCMDSADYREARTAFLEKRQPKFIGA